MRVAAFAVLSLLLAGGESRAAEPDASLRTVESFASIGDSPRRSAALFIEAGKVLNTLGA
jgi:hypothetical protein